VVNFKEIIIIGYDRKINLGSVSVSLCKLIEIFSMLIVNDNVPCNIMEEIVSGGTDNRNPKHFPNLTEISVRLRVSWSKSRNIVNTRLKSSVSQ
jgi:hypothetical protein